MPVVELEDVGLVIAGKPILEGVTLSAARGETVALLGPSGSGKSSLLRLVLGFTAPTHGQVKLDGLVVSRPGKVLVPPEERRLAVVFQDLALWPHLTVHQHLDFGLGSQGLSREERGRRIGEVLERVSLRGEEDRLPGGLSGGERQRVAIGRALVLRPRAVLLDEPLASLDVALRRELLASFRSLLREQEVTTIFVTHDLREAAGLGARAMVIEAGRVSQSGTIAELTARPATAFVRALAQEYGSGSYYSPGAPQSEHEGDPRS